jgi:hypothetical protein
MCQSTIVPLHEATHMALILLPLPDHPAVIDIKLSSNPRDEL